MEESDFAEMVVPDTEDDGATDDRDFDSRQTHKTGSTKSISANMCGNPSKRGQEIANATGSEVKKALLKENRTSDEIKKRKRKHRKMESRRKEPNITLRDSHPQEPLEASSKMRKENNGGIKSDEFGKEGKEEDNFYASLLRNYLADAGLDFGSLDKATQSILVEDWNDLMLAWSTHELLKAKFDKKIYQCICGVYEVSIKKSTTPQHS